MNSSPLFSVVIPAYNRAHSIGRAISSVLNQKLQDFEIIIVDDGSVDNTQQVVLYLNKKDSRLIYIKQENGGAAKARNTGIMAARGKYIAFLDSDDVFLENHFYQSISALQSKNNACVYSKIVVNRGNNISFIKPTNGPNVNDNFSEYLICKKGFVPTITLIVPRELAKRVLYDETVGYGDDKDFAIRLHAAGGQFIMLDTPGACWDDIWNDNRLSSKIDPVERLSWIHKNRSLFTDKAYYGFLSSVVAKGYSDQGQKAKAFKVFFSAILKSNFSFKTAVMYFLQILLDRKSYRVIADSFAKYGVKP